VGCYSRHAAAPKRLEKLTVFRRIIAPLTMASIVAGCSASTNPYASSTTDPGNTLPPPVSAAQVNATPSIAFTPPTIALNVGGTVTFAFGSVAHNVFFDNDPTGAPATIDGANANTSVQRTFPVAGFYKYYCHIHPGMSGMIVVGGGGNTADGESTGSGGYNRLR
jgi:plastocyanin